MVRKIAAAVLFLTVVCTVGSGQAAQVQWAVADGGNNHWYEVFVVASGPLDGIGNGGIHFQDAKAAASGKGGYLATPDISGEADFLYDNVTKPAASGHVGFWLGAYADSAGGEWKWVTGGTVLAWGGYPYIDWAEGSGAYGITQFTDAWWTTPRAIQDLRQDILATGYVVEYDTNPVPAPGSLLLLAPGLAGIAAIRRRLRK
jgi:hypothetical protein